MPAARSNKTNTGSAGHRTTNEVKPCIICGEVVSRPRDMPRHMKKHSSSDDNKYSCPWEGCTFRTIQKTNFETHYRRHIQDKSHRCLEDTCTFGTSDPASLLRHRKRWHGYIPKHYANRKTKKNPSKTASKDSSSVASSSSMESSLLLSPYTGPLSSVTSSLPMVSPLSLSPSTSSLYPSGPFSFGESQSTTFIPSITETQFNEFMTSINPSHPPLHHEGLLFPPLCSYNYAWNTSALHEFDSLAASPETGKQEFQYPYQCQQGEYQLQPKDSMFPLIWPNVDQVFPGYETTGQLHGSHGFSYGLENSVGLNYVDQSQLNNLHGDLSFHQTHGNTNFINLAASHLDYFDSCQWDFGCSSPSSILDSQGGGSL